MGIHKAVIIPIHLKARVKAYLDRDVRLGILEKVNVNSPVRSRMIVTMKKDGSPRQIIDYKRLTETIPCQINITQSPVMCASACPPKKKENFVGR